MASYYSAGTVSVTTGSPTVTGSGTAWLAAIAAGDRFTVVQADGTQRSYVVASVESDISLTLHRAFVGTTASGRAYFIQTDYFGGRNGELADDVSALLAELGNFPTSLQSAITGAAVKSTVVDADTTVITDSAASFAIKEITFTTIWTWITTKFTALTAKTTPIDADAVVITDSAASNVGKQLTFANLRVWISNQLTAFTAKTTPVDADAIVIIDSAASNIGKKLTFANLAAWILSKLDIEYGTWTVEFYDAFTGGNVSATTGTGYYFKIDQWVFGNIPAILNISTAGMTGANILYYTLPFTQNIALLGGSCVWGQLTYTGYESIAPYGGSAAARASFLKIRTGNTTANVIVSEISTGVSDLFRIQFAFRIAA